MVLKILQSLHPIVKACSGFMLGGGRPFMSLHSVVDDPVICQYGTDFRHSGPLSCQFHFTLLRITFTMTNHMLLIIDNKLEFNESFSLYLFPNPKS